MFGLWGVLVVVPFIRDLAAPALGSTLGHYMPLFAVQNTSGYSVLAAGIVLAIMVFPLIVAVVDEVMRSTPQEMRESLLSLGATKWETTRCIVRRRGLTGIIAAVVLGFSRAIGETLAVLMVVGNVTQVPHSIFDAAYTLPALIANNYGEMMSSPPLRISPDGRGAAAPRHRHLLQHLGPRRDRAHRKGELRCSAR